MSAAYSPWVWAPLASAGLLQIDSWDESLSDWARDETPVFGSQGSADDWSDGLRTASIVGYGVSVLATRGGELDADWLATTAAVFDTLTTRNLGSTDMSPLTRSSLAVRAGAVTIGTSWARVEAGAHYPSDVPFGMALGNFVGAWFNDAFLGTPAASLLALSVEPLRNGGAVHWNWRF